MHLRDRPHPALPQTHLRPAAGPHRHPHGSPARGLRQAGKRHPWRAFRRDPRAHQRGADTAAAAPRRHAAGLQRGYGAGADPRVLHPTRGRASPDARRDAPDASERASVSPDFEGVAHDGRIFAFGFGGHGGDPDAPSGGGVAVSGQGAGYVSGVCPGFSPGCAAGHRAAARRTPRRPPSR